MLERIVRGPLLIPKHSGVVDYHPDGALAADAAGVLAFAGPWEEIRQKLPAGIAVRKSKGVMLPPLLDIHTHIPQHPIRGRFVEGVPDDAPEGKLLVGLRQNVFPAEARCDDATMAGRVVGDFLADTLSHGVVGGAAYMTPSTIATEIALANLPSAWSVGLVMMDQNCPENLRTDWANFESDVERLAGRFGRRLIITDRFAVAVSTALRRRGAALAGKFGLRTQTHLNEQLAEKAMVETVLYPEAASYTDVYRRDGLLDHACIVAHCIQMKGDEFQILRDTGATIAHCPTSNLLLGSGLMPLDEVMRYGIPYAIATDMGASPTVSMLAEMARFLRVHEGKSNKATPAEALFRATLAPAELLGLDAQIARLEPGRPMSFIEVLPASSPVESSADGVIRSLLPKYLDQPVPAVGRVTMAGRVVFERSREDA